MSQQPQPSGQRPRANLYQTAVDLPEESRIPVIQLLNQALADATDLQSQAKFAHWNVKGTDFYQLHELFDDVAAVLSEHVDMLAERTTALGGQAMGTTRLAAAASQIHEPPHDRVNEVAYLEWFADHLAFHANRLRSAIDAAAELGDEDTADLFTELSREVDEQLYFVESHLQSGVVQRIPATSEQTAPQEAPETAGPGTGTHPWTGSQPQAAQQPRAGGRAPPAQGSPGGQAASGGQAPPQAPSGGQPQFGGQTPPGGQPQPGTQSQPGTQAPSGGQQGVPAEQGAQATQGGAPEQGTASEQPTSTSSEDEDDEEQ